MTNILRFLIDIEDDYDVLNPDQDRDNFVLSPMSIVTMRIILRFLIAIEYDVDVLDPDQDPILMSIQCQAGVKSISR